jgi:uncharacterized HAD superfamily protein
MTPLQRILKYQSDNNISDWKMSKLLDVRFESYKKWKAKGEKAILHESTKIKLEIFCVLRKIS